MKIVEDVKRARLGCGARVGARARRRRARARGAEPKRCRARRCSRSPTASGAGTRRSVPVTSRLEIEPGVVLARRLGAAPLGRRLCPARAHLDAGHVHGVPAQVAGVERIVVVTPPSGAGLVAAAAEALGVDEVWALGGPQAIAWLAYVGACRPDRRSRERVRERGEAGCVARRSDRPPAGPSEVVVGRVERGRPADRRARAGGAGRARGRTRVCRVVKIDSQQGGGARARASRAARRRGRGARGRTCGTPARCSSARRLPSLPATTPPAATTCFRPEAGRAAVGGLGIETFLKPLTIQRLTPDGLARVRPVVEALAAAEGMPAHAAAVRR